MRQKIVKAAASYVGFKESNGSHKQIIDIYNGHTPLARGYKVKYTDEWCATFVSAVAITCNATDIIPTECSCARMIEAFQKIGAWQEKDSYVPQPGDVIFYDWQDSGEGDNKGHSDHVGIVEHVSGNSIRVIEGNKNEAVGRRTLKVNGRYIRGYGVPKYKDEEEQPAASLAFQRGDVVMFTGSKHFASATINKGPECKPGKAKVTAISTNGVHPYHLIALEGSGSNVYGWVDACDVKAVEEIIVGDVVQFAGGNHYATSNADSAVGRPKAGPAKVTAINRKAKHPFHIVHTTGASSVYGWVDADKVHK